jgi:CRP-like cAMP-binding protein
MTSQTHPHQRNRLLAALPEPAWQRLRPALESVMLTQRQSLHESGQPMTHAHFPTSATVSLMHVTASGASAESAVVGNDGMVGISLLMGGGSTCGRAVVQTAGHAFRLPAPLLQKEFNLGGATMLLFLRYMQALLTQTSLRAVCNRHHSLAQQLAGCLLSAQDAAEGGDILMTQELIADRLGVRREGVTDGAYLLQKLGLIRYARGRISVLDREGLERRACECYAVGKQECRRLLPELLAA